MLARTQSSLLARGRGWSTVVVPATVAVMLSMSATPAGAIVAKVGARAYGVTPIAGVSPARVPGARLAPGSSGITGATSPRNYDGPPLGGGPLLYQGGPVMHSNTTHVIYWDPNEEFTAGTKKVLGRYFTDVAHDSGLASNVFGVAGQYTDATGNAAYSSTFGGAEVDADPYPSSGNCTVPTGGFADPGPPYTKCVFDLQLQEEISKYIGAHSLPKGQAQLYFLLLPHKVATCFNEAKAEEEIIGPICSNNFFCAYHGYISPGTPGEIIYADIPFSLLDSAHAKACQGDGNPGIQRPNGDAAGTNASTRYADVALGSISHEFSEAITDPLVGKSTAWADANGQEVGDKCTAVGPDVEEDGIGYDEHAYLPILGGTALGENLFDQSINTDPYYQQSEWDNGVKACLMEPLSLGAVAFTPSPASGIVGSPISFSGSASDPYGGLGFTWSFGDGGAGTGSSPSHTYAAAGEYTVTMTPKDRLTDSTATPVSHTILVNAPEERGNTGGPAPAIVGQVSANTGVHGAAGFRVSVSSPVPDAKLASTALQASSSGIVSIKVSCPTGESSCSGTATLRTLGAVSASVAGAAKLRATALTLATGSFTVPGGTVKTVTLHLSARARTLLARLHVLRVRATIAAHDPAGAKHTRQAIVTLRAPRGSHKR